MGIRKYSPLEMTAIALLALGEEGAAQVLRNMRPEEVRRLTAAMSRIGHVDQETADQALRMLRDQMQRDQSGVTGNVEAARRILGRTLGDDASNELDDMLDAASPRLREVLGGTEPRDLAPFLEREHPQSAAVILAHLDARTAAATLKFLPDERRVEILERLADLGPIEPETLHDLADTLEQALAGRARLNRPDLGGTGKVAALLNALDREHSDRLLKSLDDTNPKLAVNVRAEMFRFGDLPRLGDPGIQVLLRHVPEATLLLALKAAPEDVAASIFRNMSARAAARLKDDLSVLPKTRKSEVDDAQRRIVDTILKLLESGELEMPDPNDTYV